MLDDALKKDIQQAYSGFLQAKNMKPRYGQKMMIAEIARTLGSLRFDEEGHCISEKNIAVVEAGTGTGKTVAYLLATLPVAKALDKRVVLSTATIALQEQVSLKDIPDVLLHSGLQFSYTLAKGRGRYVCLSKLERILSDSQGSEAAFYEDEVIAVSAQDLHTYRDMMQRSVDGEWDGDKDSWPDEIEVPVWQRVTTDHRQCSGRKCPNIRDCAFFHARDSLENADLIVANHDLVLADLALGGGAILPSPEETIYIFDEGHHLPEKALNHFAAHTRYRSTIRWLGQSEGQWPKLKESLAELSYFCQLSEPLEADLKAARTVLEDGLPLVRALCDDIELDQNTPRKLFPLGEVGPEIEHLAGAATRAFERLEGLLTKLYREIETTLEQEHNLVPRKDLEVMLGLLGSWLTRAEGNLALWQQYRETRFDEKMPFARWVTLLTHGDTPDYEFVGSPVLASGILQRSLWSRCCGAVVTSATLRALNRFDRFTLRAGLFDNAHCAAVPSPFDYATNGELCIPSASEEANRSVEHTESLIRLLPDIIHPEQGTLVLFSSNAQMKQVFEAMPESVRSRIYCQGLQSKQKMIELHKRDIDAGQGSVLWGLASFAEGVDLPGDYCRHVIIAKLPFSVPDEPLEAAFSEWIEARGGNSFMEVTVPDASIRLVQACGRLLRTESDQGRVTILDKRLISKRYGKLLLDSLPPFRRVD